MGFREFQVQLDNPTKAYFPGQNVSGNIRVDKKEKESKIEGITVQFLGRASFHWTEQVTETTGSGDNRKDETKTIVYSNEEEYFNCKIILIGNAKISAGHHSFPFNFTLPIGLPSSYVGRAGQVMYQLKVKIKRQNSRKYKKTIPFTVNGILDLNIEPGANLALEQRKHKNLCCLFCKSGPVGFVLKSPKKGFVPGEILRFQVEMNNQSRRKVRKSTVTLIQNIYFHARGKTLRDSRIICKQDGPGVERGDSEFWMGNTLQIPAIPPTRLANCRIIDIQYFLQFEMDLSGPSINLRGEVPIIVGTIPFRNMFQEFTPHVRNMGSTCNELSGPSTSASAFAPSAPSLDDYPDLPPPSYAEAMFSDPVNPVATPSNISFTNLKASMESEESERSIPEKAYAPTQGC
jgi:hypothetical protein